MHAMFGRVPATYDLCNRLLTLRLDERWRRQAAAVCLEGRPARVLDLGTGTGDLALWLRRLAPAGAPASIVGLDYSLPMLQAARQKAQRRGAADRRVARAGSWRTRPRCRSRTACSTRSASASPSAT